MKSQTASTALALTLTCSVLIPATGYPLEEGDALSRAIDVSLKTNRGEASTQRRIDRLSAETRRMLEEYHTLSRELDALRIYDNQLERLVKSQSEEKQSIQQQMIDMELTQREIVPLMLRMVAELEAFIDADHPFLLEERRARVAQLRDLMDAADVSAGEKYRRVMEAYQIEMEYARTIEAYRGELSANGATRTVDFMRVGRLSIYYQTLDGQESGQWNARTMKWEVLPSRYTLPIRQGLRIARKQAAPDLLRLPLPAPE